MNIYIYIYLCIFLIFCPLTFYLKFQSEREEEVQERLTENDRIFVAELYPYKSFLKSKIWISTSKKESKDGKRVRRLKKESKYCIEKWSEKLVTGWKKTAKEHNI